jgi:hypothetical protein
MKVLPQKIAYVSIIDHNKQYRPLARAWAYSARINNIENCFIYSLCPQTFTFLNEIEGIKAKYIDPENLCRSRSRFKKIPHGKIRACLELIEEFDAVVFCDLDAFFLKNPTAKLAHLFEENDILMSTSIFPTTQPPELGKTLGWVLCTGFFGIKKSNQGLHYLKDMDKQLPLSEPPSLQAIKDRFPYRSHIITKNLQVLTNFYFEKHLTVPEGSFCWGGKKIHLLPQKLVKRGKHNPSVPIEDVYVYHPFSRDKKLVQFSIYFPDFKFGE